jgi:hypothetical protein
LLSQVLTSAIALEFNDMTGIKQIYYDANGWNPPSALYSKALDVSVDQTPKKKEKRIKSRGKKK